MSFTKPLSHVAQTVVGQTANDEPPDIPGFTIKRRLGQGGMGSVYLAHQAPPMNCDVAIKTIRPELAAVPALRRRFLEEIEKHAQLAHPSILPIRSSGEVGNSIYLVMAYAAGGSLRDRIEISPGRPDECARVICTIAEGLHYAHDRADPIAHLDVKPENILFLGGHPVLADFGVSKELAASVVGTLGIGSIVGDPRYWAPEQAEGQPSTASDIYSLGLVFYELLTGARPETRLVRTQRDREAIAAGLPRNARRFGPLITRCLSVVPAERPTAAELADSIGSLVQKRRQIWPWIAAIAMLAIVFAALNPDMQAAVRDFQRRISPPPTYAVTFSFTPAITQISVDGKALRGTGTSARLESGAHDAVAVANGYVGEYRQLQVTDADLPTVAFALKPRTPITDAEFLRFGDCLAQESCMPADQTWSDAALTEVANLDRLDNDAGRVEFDQHISRLKKLAAVGDGVANTALYYARLELEGMKQDYGPLADYLDGLNRASEAGYGLASMLRAMHTLNELQTRQKRCESELKACEQAAELIQRARSQGLPAAADLLDAVLATWKMPASK